MTQPHRYNADKTYRWNYDHAPVEQPEVDVPPVPGSWTFCGLPVDSPLGIPAGPLLNRNWGLYYAALGFDVLTYKTVRSTPRECYDLPNLVPVSVHRLDGAIDSVPAADEMTGSWAVSFGMPSAHPDQWRKDVERTRNQLPKGKLLSVSVVGTVQEGWSLDDLADDYARCARWAVDAGAHCIETNFSCPNVSTCDGQLYQQPADAALVAQRVRSEIGETPCIVKIGHTSSRIDAALLLEAVAGSVDALAMTNSVATRVQNSAGQLLFGGERRGICGDATRLASLEQTRLFAGLAAARGLPIRIIGVGGASTADHVRDYLAAGAEAVHIATAAMTNPDIGLSIRQGLNQSRTESPASQTTDSL